MSWISDHVTPASIAETAEILAGDAEDRPWMPCGGGTLLGRGSLPREQVRALDLTRCRGIIEHAADDLTVTVEAGISLADLQRALAGHGQWLPLSLDPEARSTVGGWIGADRRTLLAGSWGSVRDYLLGMAWLDGRGRTIRAGGRVVKNVAGYDLMKLHTGALGELGAIVEATFKVLPRPSRWGGMAWRDPEAPMLRRALEEGPKLFPAGLWRYDPGDGETLVLVFAGSAARVEGQVKRAHALLGSSGTELEEETVLSLAASLERMTRPGPECVAWGGALPEWLGGQEARDVLGGGSWSVDLLRGHFWTRWVGDDAALARARTALRTGEGHLHLDAPSDRPLDHPWGGRGPDVRLAEGLKRAMDPEHRFVSGRWPAR